MFWTATVWHTMKNPTAFKQVYAFTIVKPTIKLRWMIQCITSSQQIRWKIQTILCVVDLTGRVYCVVSAKKICILLCFPTISLVWSVQIITRAGGNWYWQNLIHSLFYLFVMLFNINITSSQLHGVVLYSQVLSLPSMGHIIMLTLESQPKVLNAVKAVFSLYSPWNLDFFHSVILNICLHASTIEALALEYAIAVYTIILIIVSYTLIELYDRNVWFIVYLWKPFYWILSFFRKKLIEISVLQSLTHWQPFSFCCTEYLQWPVSVNDCMCAILKAAPIMHFITIPV